VEVEIPNVRESGTGEEALVAWGTEFEAEEE